MTKTYNTATYPNGPTAAQLAEKVEQIKRAYRIKLVQHHCEEAIYAIANLRDQDLSELHIEAIRKFQKQGNFAYREYCRSNKLIHCTQ